MTLAKLAVVLGLTARGYHRGLAAASASADRFTGRMGRLRGGLGRATAGMIAFGKRALLVGAILATVVVAGLGFAVNAAIAYEDAFAGVRKTVQATEPELAALSAEIRQMATEIPIAATELAKLGEIAGALGVPTDQIAEFIRVTALIGVTTNVSSDVAADALGRLSNILGLTAADYSRFGSTLVALGNAGASTEAEILEITKRMGAAGLVAGLSTPQILGWASALASVSGMEPERAGTSMQMFLIATTKIASKAGKKLTLMAKTAGVTGKAFRQLFAKDANAALLKFITGLGKLTKAQKLATLEALGFNESGITRALLGMAGASEEVTRQILLGNEAWERNSALTEEAEKRFATTKSQLALLKNNLFDIAITLGDALLPVLVPLIKGLSDWISKNRDLIAQLASDLAGGIGAVVSGIGGWIEANRPLIDGVMRLGRQIFDFVVPKILGFINALVGPGGVAESVMGVVGPILNNLLPALGGIINSLFGGGGGGHNGRVGAKKGLLPAIGDLIGVLWGNGTGALAEVLKIIGSLMRELLPAIGEVIDILTTLVGWVIKAVDWFGDLIAKVKEFLGINARAQQQAPPGANWFNLPVPKMGTPKFADGGFLPAGRIGIAGEGGRPEFITGGRSGVTVTPVEAAGGRGGDTNITINNPEPRAAEPSIAFTMRRLQALGIG